MPGAPARMRKWVAGLLVAAGCACAPGSAAPGAAAAPLEANQQRAGTIDHVAPPRDSTGATPSRFEWTAFDGADTYTMGVWNDVDVPVYRESGLTTTSVVWPTDFRLEPGTYFWSVVALRDGRQVAESGRAAFVVLR